MEKEVLVAIVGSVTTVAVAIGGWVFGWLMQRDARTRERQRNQIDHLKDEVRARIEVENTASQWLAELTHKTPRASKT